MNPIVVMMITPRTSHCDQLSIVITATTLRATPNTSAIAL